MEALLTRSRDVTDHGSKIHIIHDTHNIQHEIRTNQIRRCYKND